MGKEILAVALGGAIGAVARYSAGAFAVDRLGWRPFAATLGINLVGCFALGVLYGVLERSLPGGVFGAEAQGWRLVLGVGLLGSFTTFSAFSYDTLVLLREGAPWLAVGNTLAQCILGLLALAAGRVLAGL